MPVPQPLSTSSMIFAVVPAVYMQSPPAGSVIVLPDSVQVPDRAEGEVDAIGVDGTGLCVDSQTGERTPSAASDGDREVACAGQSVHAHTRDGDRG
jgi:hypothetical protein